MKNEIPYENAFINMGKKSYKGIAIWTALSILLILIGFGFFFFYTYFPEESQYAYIQQIDEQYHFVIYIKKEEIYSFPAYQLKIEDENIPFRIDKIGQAMNIDGDIYYEVVLDVEIKESWKIHNNILRMIVTKTKTTWYQKIKKGMHL